jgi:hypothetical protein
MSKSRTKMSLSALIVTLAALTALLSGCAIGWDEEDYCGPDEVCESCGDDHDCAVTLSCCGETMFCYSKFEDTFSICQLGCYEPDPPPCRCVDGRCRFR